jgi:hypothetical protein
MFTSAIRVTIVTKVMITERERGSSWDFDLSFKREYVHVCLGSQL